MERWKQHFEGLSQEETAKEKQHEDVLLNQDETITKNVNEISNGSYYET